MESYECMSGCRLEWVDPVTHYPIFEISVQKLYRANPQISGVKLGMTPWAVGLPIGSHNVIFMRRSIGKNATPARDVRRGCRRGDDGRLTA